MPSIQISIYECTFQAVNFIFLTLTMVALGTQSRLAFNPKIITCRMKEAVIVWRTVRGLLP